MDNQIMTQLVGELSRDMLSEVAPQELPLFRAASQAYFKNPNALPKTGGDDMLGFGAGEAMSLLTPYLLPAVTEVIKFLAEEIKKAVGEESASLIGEKVKSLFKKHRNPDESKNKVPPLTAEQLAQVQAIAVKEARRLRLSDKNTKLLANAIAGSLAVKKG
ncbi:MAG: hypothetical protein KPEEDBHJ_01189 [Anaerolineales bacterium]|nr:hypothetical protein [Anaerolineales bacterium]